MYGSLYCITRRSLAVLLAAASLSACSDSVAPSAEPTMQMVAGLYQASESFGALSLTTTADGHTIDWIAAGTSILLELNSDGTTTGRLFIPGGDEDGGDLDADLTGTWTLSGGTVRLSHAADTFLRDMDFTFRDSRLEGEETFGEVTVSAVLASSK